jgi:hypothetical protein
MPNRLRAEVQAALGGDAADWMEDTRAAVAAGTCVIGDIFPAVSRRVGRGPLGAPPPRSAWRVDDGARALLLLALKDRDPGGVLATARDLYFAGEARERIGVLRALPLLGDAPDALPAVLDAVRVSQAELFEAAICDNAYASAHLPALEFRKAVLKCVFVGLSPARVERLAERADPELCQGLYDYVLEREAASRPVPPEVWPYAALHAPPGLLAKLIGVLEHPDARHRAAAAAALRRLEDPRATPFLDDRAARERDPEVRRALGLEA